MPTHPFSEILRHLQATQFRDVAGSSLSATVPVSERLINEVVTASVPRGAPVREVHVQPLANNAFSVRISPRAPLLPSISLRLTIDRQPAFPEFPVLVLRLATMGGLLGLAGAALPIARLLPPGVHLDGDRISVDLRTIAADRGLSEYLAYVSGLRVNTEAGRVVLHLDLRVP